ncbi:MAG: hypothetical protein Q7T82_18755 [Armatimonadota bacterium]|nr:hypothetical protein [Armatimonadota bacterium]
MPESVVGFVLENDYARYVVGQDGASLHLIDKSSGKDYCDRQRSPAFASVKQAGRICAATSVSSADGKVTVEFGDAGARAVLMATAKKGYFILEVLSVTGDNLEELVFADVNLTLHADPDEPFACCAMALNLLTNCPDIPGLNNRLRASCYARFGFEGAKAAIVACPTAEMRGVMQEIILSDFDLPHSKLGGPWALDAEINRGSYLFNFRDLSEDTVDRWIELAKSLGLNQIDFHGGESFRMGDFRPNPETYPRGRASFKAVIDKLHAAGIKAGLHTYVFFMDKACPWVTPVPDHRLGFDAVFTLAEPVSADAAVVPVVESTENMTTVTGFFERNSVTLRIGDELVTYDGISKTPPYALTGCQRGAYGTRASAHRAREKAYHLTECFGYFAPGGDSALLTEVAATTAEMFNECGFDMMYLDALDGEDILCGGWDYAWHYGSKFVFELCKRLDTPALIEMSAFRHHLWYVRSRIGAMDYPTRSQKRFIDIHCEGSPHHVHAKGNKDAAKMFLPAQLGWWSVHAAGDPQVERTFPDDIEYLMCKGMATDTGFALIGIDLETIESVPAFQRLAPIFKRYEDLRHGRYFPESVCKRLGVAGAEFTLEQFDGWQLRPVEYPRHKVERVEISGNRWSVENRFGPQPLRLRIEALWSAAPYDSPDAVTLADFADPAEFEVTAQGGVTADLAASSEKVKVGAVSGRYSAANSGAAPNGAWTKAGKLWSPYLDLGERRAIGVWVYGDGNGETLNLQLRSPEHHAFGLGDHHMDIDFTGWRYFELIEPEAERVSRYSWPYGTDLYGIYRERVDFGCIGSLSLWYNGLPVGKQVECYVSPIKALPLAKGKVKNPRVTIAGETVVFPVEIESGSYLEFRSDADYVVYGPKGELLAEVRPEGGIPTLQPGPNDILFECETDTGVSARANVTVMTRSEEILR